MGMTARFHKSWADFGGLKPYPALEYETSLMIAHGARCSVGDQLHPRGVPDHAAYELIGKAYARVEEREPWLRDATAVTQIGLVQLPKEIPSFGSSKETDDGAVRMLTQMKHQFDVVSEATELERYELLILPDALQPSPALVKRLGEYLRKGGKVLATGTSGLSVDGAELLLPELGIRPLGMSPYSVTYLRFGNEVKADVPSTDHVMYERGVRATGSPGTRVLARVVEPYFERAWNHFCSHRQTPGDRVSRFAAATLNGRSAHIAFPIFRAYALHGNYPYRLLVRNILGMLLPEPLVRIDAPTGVEVSVMKQGKRTITHLLYYSAERRAKDLDLIEDIVPLHDLPLSVKLVRQPARAYLAPDMTPVPLVYRDGYAHVTVPELRGHAMVVLE